jgi:DNA-binding NtrC family response regulator
MLAEILIVDDDPQIVSILQRLLVRVDRTFSIRTAASAEQALDMLAERPANIVLTDLRMPGMSGLQLLEQVRILYPRTIVIVMTAYGHDALIKARAMGAWAVLSKPFPAKELARIIRQALEEADKTRE